MGNGFANSLTRLAIAIAVASPLLLQTACQAGAQSSAPVQATQPVGRVIVKLRQPVADEAALMKLIQEKFHESNRIAFLRAISNDAYVLMVVAPATKGDLPKIMEQLGATGLFEYVEEDKMMTIHRPTN
jgi:hypothetical protein